MADAIGKHGGGHLIVLQLQGVGLFQIILFSDRVRIFAPPIYYLGIPKLIANPSAVKNNRGGSPKR